VSTSGVVPLVSSEPTVSTLGSIGRPTEDIPAAGGSARSNLVLADLALATTAWAVTEGLRRSDLPACMRTLKGKNCQGDTCSGCWSRPWWAPASAIAWEDRTGRVVAVTMERWTDSASLDAARSFDTAHLYISVRTHDAGFLILRRMRRAA
jgi:hypothetical protein